MQKHHIARKRFGQNFLIDEYIINQIISIINLKKDDFIVEIGPGLGALTNKILNYISPISVIELDRDLVTYLQQKFNTQLIIYAQDALKFDYSFANKSIRIIGNLPYNISTPLLFHLSKFNNIIDMHFMLQQEVVERICAKPNNHSYGKLSVMLQYKYTCEKLLTVDNSCFDPKPKVQSAIVKLTPKPQTFWKDINLTTLNLLVSSAFNQRRKTIQNSLSNFINATTLEKLNFNPKLRAENLSVDDYITLSKFIESHYHENRRF